MEIDQNKIYTFVCYHHGPYEALYKDGFCPKCEGLVADIEDIEDGGFISYKAEGWSPALEWVEADSLSFKAAEPTKDSAHRAAETLQVSACKAAPPAEEAQDQPRERATFDQVNNPPHYNQGGIECFDAIKASLSPEEYKGYLRGQIIKYIWRMNHKGNSLQDAQKASWYLNKLIQQQKEQGE